MNMSHFTIVSKKRIHPHPTYPNTDVKEKDKVMFALIAIKGIGKRNEIYFENQ